MNGLMLKRLLASLAISLVMLLAPFLPVVSVGAEEWSDEDPVVLIVTPKGNLVPVFNTMGVLGLKNAVALALAKVNYTVASVDGGKATQVSLTVTIPNHILGKDFPTRTTISSGPLGTLKVHGTTSGMSAKPMNVQFKLPVP
ncbi:MAG: hypothetical protein NTZ05_19015 [Chloroflexi bacterium]|nr:hypothetical protein [Chloroflexota bacterium]